MPEEKTHSQFAFLRGKPVMAVTAVLALEIILFYSIPTKEYIPMPPPLETFNQHVGPWTMAAQYPIDDYTQNLLKADDTLTRTYAGPSNLELFVAFFKTQRAGVTPHSPKMCLPANGWAEESAGLISVNVPGERAAIPVNRYVVAKDGQRKLVLYWYQNQHRVMTSEYLSKIYLIYDSLRYRRSDEALVRVITDIGGSGDAGAEQHAIQFIQDLYQPLRKQMWSGATNAAVQPLLP
jgi:EpsI family protein